MRQRDRRERRMEMGQAKGKQHLMGGEVKERKQVRVNATERKSIIGTMTGRKVSRD